MTSLTARLEGTWLEPDMLGEAYDSYEDNLALDDDDTGFLHSLSSNPASIFVFDGSGWVSPAATTGGGFASSPVAVEGGGHGLFLVKPGPGLIGRRLRAPAGTFGTAGTTTTTSTVDSLRVDVGAGGCGAIAWIEDNSVELWRSQAAMASWARAPGYSPGIGAALAGFDMAVSGTGQVVQVWADSRPTVDLSQQFVAARVVDASNAQVGSVVDLLPGSSGTQIEPRVEVDAAGNAIAIFRDIAAVYANRYAAGSGWGTAVVLSTNDSSGQNTLQLEVAANGSAIAGWMQNGWLIGDQPMELWVARYSPASGWGSARRINTPGAHVTSFDMGISATGASLVVWKEASFAGLRTASP